MVRWFVRSVRSFDGSFVRWFVRSFDGSFVRSFDGSFVRWFVRSRSMVRSFVRWFDGSFVRSVGHRDGQPLEPIGPNLGKGRPLSLYFTLKCRFYWAYYEDTNTLDQLFKSFGSCGIKGSGGIKSGSC